MGIRRPMPGLDPLDLEDLVPLDERDDQTGRTGPGGATRAVEVGLVVLRRVEVDDHVDRIDVQAAGGDVGGHQDVELALGEVLQGPLPVGLAEVAVDGAGLDALPCPAARPAGRQPCLVRTNTSALSALRQMAAQTFTRSIWWTSMKRCSMASTVVGRRGHLVEDRVVHVAADQAVDGAVERGGEQQGLVVALEAAQHPLDLGHEAHVGHAVGLVEDQGLDVGDRQLAPVAQVDEPARGGDDHVDAPAELLDLTLDVGAAVDGDGPESGRLGQGLEHFAHLDGELAGRDEHQRLRAARLGGR